MPRDPFGVLAFLHWNHPWNDQHFDRATLDRAIRQLKDLGVSSLRLDILWADVHRGQGLYDFSHYEELISRLHREGFELLVLLQYNKERGEPARYLWNVPPDISEFAAYVKATIENFKDRIHLWEIWNEPNHPVYWNAPPDRLKTYTSLLKASYQAAKTADPACVVLNGGLTEPLRESLTDLYANGAREFFDILSIHTFFDPLSPESEENFHKTIAAIESLMDQNGDRVKKIWITEMGSPGVPPEKQGGKNWWAGPNLSMEQQAQALHAQYQWIKQHPRIEKLFWAFYRDTDGALEKGMFEDGTDFLGLVRFDLTPKPSYYQMKKLIGGS